LVLALARDTEIALCPQADESRAGELHFVMELTNSAAVNCRATL
jgi:hypothetical protein